MKYFLTIWKSENDAGRATQFISAPMRPAQDQLTDCSALEKRGHVLLRSVESLQRPAESNEAHDRYNLHPSSLLPQRAISPGKSGDVVYNFLAQSPAGNCPPAEGAEESDNSGTASSRSMSIYIYKTWTTWHTLLW